MNRRLGLVLWCVVLGAACKKPVESPDASVPVVDASVPDAGALPDAARSDAAMNPDAATADAAQSRDAAVTPDAAMLDAGIRDASVPDAAVTDAAATPDAAMMDAGATEMATVHVVGRTLPSGNNQRFSWPGVAVRTVVEGDGMTVTLSGASGIWFQRAVDGVKRDVVITTGNMDTFTLSGLGAGRHTVEVVRRNEAFFGESTLVGVAAVSGATLVPSPVRQRRVAFLGDSLTAGYGIEGAGPSCPFTADTESAYASYAWVAARALNADAHIMAWSGKGVAQNYGGDTTDPLPALWNRTLAESATELWDHTQWVPHVVVVNLGTNDFSAPIADATFVNAYAALLTDVRARYPNAAILCVRWDSFSAAQRQLVTDAVAQAAVGNATTVDFAVLPAEGWGCDYHTSEATNARLGMELAGTIRTQLGW